MTWRQGPYIYAFSLLSCWNAAWYHLFYSSPGHPSCYCWLAVLVIPRAWCAPLDYIPSISFLTALSGLPSACSFCVWERERTCWVSLPAAPDRSSLCSSHWRPLIDTAAHRTTVPSPLMNAYGSIKRNLFKLHEKNQQTCLALCGFLLFCFLWPDGPNQGWKCPRFPDLSSTDSL